MPIVLVTVAGGLISSVKFYTEESVALKALADYVKSMDKEKDDAAVYTSEGLIANAKSLFKKGTKKNRPVYIVGNPTHCLVLKTVITPLVFIEIEPMMLH